jgi:hypothetical protein
LPVANARTYRAHSPRAVAPVSDLRPETGSSWGVGRNRKAWGVSPRYLRVCDFSKPQRGRHRIVPAPRREPFHVTPLGFKTKRATRVSLAPGLLGLALQALR